jgi:hypothetical protein
MSKATDLVGALQHLEEHLQMEYAMGRLHSEADVQRATIGFLIDSLATNDARWLFGAEHPVHDSHMDRVRYPDVVCYYVPSDYRAFLRSPAESLVGLIEIKWRAEPRHDLDKLTRIQAQRQCVAWIIYGDHFSADIHAGYYRQQEKRAASIQAWASQHPGRGQTILRCGQIAAGGSLTKYAPILSALHLSGDFWITDRLIPPTAS